MFGHFEFIGAVHNAVSTETSKHGFNGNEMTAIAPLVFSGHYHARREYNFKNGKVVCIGCPLQLDWGDYGDTKGVYIFNTKTKEYEFVENTVNANYTKVLWSKIKQKDQSDLAKVKGNFVQLVVDEEYKFESVMKVMNVINRLQPIKNCTVSYEYSKRFNFFDQVASIDDNAIIHKTKYDHLVDYINSIGEEDLGTLELTKLEDLCKQYYKEASLKVTDED
jgi:DNA repair exonuclease SbcCD nuclease subunit